MEIYSIFKIWMIYIVVFFKGSTANKATASNGIFAVIGATLLATPRKPREAFTTSKFLE
jgi:hypothetical protein